MEDSRLHALELHAEVPACICKLRDRVLDGLQRETGLTRTSSVLAVKDDDHPSLDPAACGGSLAAQVPTAVTGLIVDKAAATGTASNT